MRAQRHKMGLCIAILATELDISMRWNNEEGFGHILILELAAKFAVQNFLIAQMICGCTLLQTSVHHGLGFAPCVSKYIDQVLGFSNAVSQQISA